MMKFLTYFYYWFVVFLFRVFAIFFSPLKVKGQERIPRAGGLIVAANHASNLDPPLIAVANPMRMKFMAKESLFKNPVLSWMIQTGGGFPVRRGATDRKAIQQFFDFLHQGWPVLIFPQGTRLGEKAQVGVGFLAVKSAMPILPVYLEGTEHLLPKGCLWPKRSPVSITFGKPFIVPEEMSYEQAAEMIMKAIFDLKDSIKE